MRGVELRYNYDTEIDLHGCRTDEAIARLERILYHTEPQSIMVIHGRGTGALKKAVRDFIRTNSYIREYHFGEDINIIGGDGVTIIYT